MKKYAIVAIDEEHIAMELNCVGDIKVIKSQRALELKERLK